MATYMPSSGRMPGAAANFLSRLLGSPAVAASNAIHAAVTDTGNTITVTTAITNPDVPRNVTATPGGTQGNITNTTVTITGTNIEDQPITEVLSAFTANSLTASVGAQAFKTVTSISIPACGTGVTTTIGTGSKLGLHRRLNRNSVFAAYLNGVREATAPTVAFNSTNIELNTATLSTTLNTTPVIVDVFDA